MKREVAVISDETAPKEERGIHAEYVRYLTGRQNELESTHQTEAVLMCLPKKIYVPEFGMFNV